MHNDIFNLKRFQFFLQRYLLLNLKSLLIAFAAMSGVLIFTSVVGALWNDGINQLGFMHLSYTLLFVGGLILTSMCFSELHRPEKSIQFLTLPASRFEKVFTAWLSTTVIFIVAAVITFYIAYFIASGFVFILKGAPFEPINMLGKNFGEFMVKYWIFQPFFFLGAVYFKGHNFLKTLLSGFVIQLLFGVLIVIFGFVVFNDVIFNAHLSNINFNLDEHVTNGNFILSTLKYVGLYVLPLFLLIVSYIRFNEREA